MHEKNTIFTQMLENKRPFVSRTKQYLLRCLKTKDPLCREQYNIYIDAWKQKTLCVNLVMSDFTHSRHSTHSIRIQNCAWTPNSLLLRVCMTIWTRRDKGMNIIIFVLRERLPHTTYSCKPRYAKPTSHGRFWTSQYSLSFKYILLWLKIWKFQRRCTVESL